MMHTSSSSVSSLLGTLAVFLCTLLLTAHARPISDAAHPTSRSTDASVCSVQQSGQSGSCRTNVSSEVIAKFRNEIKTKPHPLFLIAEMADLLHSELYYNRNSGDCTLNHDALEDTKRCVKKQILGYLSNNGVPSVNDTGCPPSYNLTYHADRYPRYQIEVLCTKESQHIRPVVGASTQRCSPYHMGDVYYLTKEQCFRDMRSGNVTDDDSGEVWNKCILNEIGVGCRYVVG